MPFPEEWNMKLPDLAGWVRQLVSTSSYVERSWCNLAKGRWEAKNHGLGDNVVMRSSPLGEEEVPKPTKDKKRRRASPPDTPKPRKSRARKSKTNPSVLSADVARTLRDKDEEGEDADCLLVARKRENIEATRTAEPVAIEEVQPQTEVISEEGPSRVPESSGVDDASCRDEKPEGTPEWSSSEALRREENAPSDLLGAININDSPPGPTFPEGQLRRSIEKRLLNTELSWPDVQQKSELVEHLREEAKMKEAETLGWKQNMDCLDSRNDSVQAQLSSVERQLQSVKEENLARAHKVKELETRLAAELARATSEAEALVASYRADAEAPNTRAKEISDAADVRLSRVAEHARRQSRRETLKEVHARGFDLTADIESAKVLKDEAGALLSDDEDSASGSESGGDEDEAPKDAAPEAD
ncbi:uncharacterized protein [Nicotiana tomentosiformis]|uniref:uncharacterized protein n=1 Tax=Nicotiana tomentosiformis TaxID=4098 RepID=UPI00388C53B5